MVAAKRITRGTKLISDDACHISGIQFLLPEKESLNGSPTKFPSTSSVHLSAVFSSKIPGTQVTTSVLMPQVGNRKGDDQNENNVIDCVPQTIRKKNNQKRKKVADYSPQAKKKKMNNCVPQPKKKRKNKDDIIISQMISDSEYNHCDSYQPNIFPFTETPGIVAQELLDDQKNEFDFFAYFFDESLVEHIVQETNRYAKQVLISMTTVGKKLSARSPIKRWVDTTVPEMYKFIAVNLLMGHIQRGSLDSYWSTEEIEEVPIFGRMMPKCRFLLLLKMIHFNNNEFQTPNDRQHKIYPLLVTMLRRFQDAYIPHKPLCR